MEQLVARQAHNLEVARSNPASATKEGCKLKWLAFFFVFVFAVKKAQSEKPVVFMHIVS